MSWNFLSRHISSSWSKFFCTYRWTLFEEGKMMILQEIGILWGYIGHICSFSYYSDNYFPFLLWLIVGRVFVPLKIAIGGSNSKTMQFCPLNTGFGLSFQIIRYTTQHQRLKLIIVIRTLIVCFIRWVIDYNYLSNYLISYLPKGLLISVTRLQVKIN